jgi:integrase
MTTLDQKTVAALALVDGETDRIFRDDDLHGFGIRVRFDKKGKLCKTWCVQYRVDGAQRRQGIGKFPRMNAATARTKAGAWLDKVHEGTDPASEREAERKADELKFSKAVAQYLAMKQRDGEVRDSSFENIKGYLTNPKYFGKLHAMPVAKITKGDINTCLNAIATAPSRSQAQRKLATFYRWAVEEGHAPTNPVPANSIKLKSRERVLSEDEIRSVWNCCRDDDYGRIIKLLLLTGCRADEIGQLKWREVDLEKGTLSLPGERTKNGRPHTLTLPPLALQIIKDVPKPEGRVHVFGKWTDSGFTNWTHQKDALGDGLAHWTVHDVRRSVVTGMAEIGIEPHVIEAVVNHVSGHKGGVAGIYNRASYKEPMRIALARWAKHVERVVHSTEGGDSADDTVFLLRA